MLEDIVSNKILILGFGPGWEDYPRDYSGEVWGLNMAAVKCERLDRLFIADKFEDKTDIRNGFYVGTLEGERGKKIPISEQGYKDIITAKNLPVVSCHEYSGMPTLEVYPLKEIVEMFGSDYFSNCIAYMIAYAIYKGVGEIELWGVRQGLLTEYAFHKGSVEFWLGMAVGHGVNVKIMGDSHLLRTPDSRLYGYRQKYEDIIKGQG